MYVLSLTKRLKRPKCSVSSSAINGRHEPIPPAHRKCYSPRAGHRGGSLWHPKGNGGQKASEEHTARKDVFSGAAQTHELVVVTQKSLSATATTT
jgi:hypothetical protein